MSMHEFEDLVEMSVKILDGCPAAASRAMRSLLWHLYDFEAKWDTGFTHFRSREALIRHRFVYQWALAEHPDYEIYRAELDAIAAQSQAADTASRVVFIRLNPAHVPDVATFKQMTFQGRIAFNRENPYGGYYRAPYLYCDADSPLWERFVDVGKLTGADAVPPDKTVPLAQVAREVV